MRTGIAIVLLSVPMLASAGKMSQQPVATADSESKASAASRADTTISNGQSLVNAPNNATHAVGAGGAANNAIQYLNDVLSIGFARGTAADALQECHERSGVKDIIAGGWGGKVEINRECRESRHEIDRMNAETARMIAEAELERIRLLRIQAEREFTEASEK